MIVISSEQFEIAAADAEKRFIDRVVERLNVRFPEQTAALGPNHTRAAAGASVQRARDYGFTSEYDLFLFCCLSFALGFSFDTDAKLPWAGATLRSAIVGGLSERLERTFELALAAASGSGRPWVPLPIAGSH